MRENQGLEPSDETLIHSLCALAVSRITTGLEGFNLPPDFLFFGLIAQDAGTDPSQLENAFGARTSVITPPLPGDDPEDDWIIRVPFGFLVPGQEMTNVTPQFAQSKAMRKCPPNTGILAVVQHIDPLGVIGNSTFSWALDVRYVVKSGYTA